jgi:DNA modification methylase
MGPHDRPEAPPETRQGAPQGGGAVMTYHLHLGDCLTVLQALPDASVDSVVTDPPYGLRFMGKRWDYDVPTTEVWAECLRVLKPGGHLLAFAGTRTQHRMAVRIEDAGFEIRDMIAWVYGSGFPKSLDVSKAIDKAAGALGTQAARFNTAGGKENCDKQDKSFRADYGYKFAPATPEAQQWAGWGTALKPSWECITVARKPLEGTVAANVLAHGTGGLNVDGCRVATDELKGKVYNNNNTGWKCTSAPSTVHGNESGRWPANLIHDGSDEVVGLFPKSKDGTAVGGMGRSASIYGTATGGDRGADHGYGEGGSAARFFKQCKGYTEAWPNLTPEPANTAGTTSSPSRQFVAFALSDAATWALPVGSCSSVSLAPSTSATANELRQLSESVITAIQSIAPKFWQESKPARLILTLGHASFAVTREQTGITTITASHWKSDGSAEPVTFNITGTNTEAGDQASAPRAFYTAKASRDDRDPGNNHPTVKPTDLMRYLCRLVTPPGGIVLDPFMGSGSTGKAALLEGFGFVGIEREEASHAIAADRLARASAAGHQLGLGL